MNFSSYLHEVCQFNKLTIKESPITQTGPSHLPTISLSLSIHTPEKQLLIDAKASGANKKDAKNKAAQSILATYLLAHNK